MAFGHVDNGEAKVPSVILVTKSERVKFVNDHLPGFAEDNHNYSQLQIAVEASFPEESCRESRTEYGEGNVFEGIGADVRSSRSGS